MYGGLGRVVYTNTKVFGAKFRNSISTQFDYASATAEHGTRGLGKVIKGRHDKAECAC